MPATATLPGAVEQTQRRAAGTAASSAQRVELAANLNAPAATSVTREAAPAEANGQNLAALPVPVVTEPIQRSLGQTASTPAIDSQRLAELSSVAASPLLPAASQAPLAAQAVAQAQSLPGIPAPMPSHKYLIETNPELTNLKQFLGSDYMLGNLGYTPENTQKRLGDGLYEQRLIREAVIARTGQRFLAGLTSDEAMFRYLMDNSIASKQALNLSVGISLSAEQVAALTHDLVWLEEYEVAGEKVLVPVLYLAQAEGRLAANGALIQGQDVTLISGGDLLNQGTLRASNNLSAVAGGSIGNKGLIEAGNRLDLLATDSIRNAQGGIIAGRDVSLTALTGDVLNERTVTHHEGSSGSRRYIQDIADSAARIEAANSLSFSTGRDLANIGGVFDSGGDIDIDVGRDVTIASAQERLVDEYGRKNRNSRTLQHGAEVSSGRNIEIIASRDFTASDGRIDAYNDITVGAGRDMTLASAANEEHFYSKTKRGSKKITRQEDHVHQQATEVSANGDVMLSANSNMVLSASRVTAGGEAYLVAGDRLSLLSAQDEDYSLYDMKKKGSWGSKKTQRDEVTDIRNVGSTITTGGDLTLVSEGNQLYQKAHLESGADLTLESGGEIAFEGVKDLKQESHEKSDDDAFWTSMKGKGNTDETLHQSVLLAQGEVVIKAVDGLKIDIKQIDKHSVSQTIDAMVQADPQLAWLKEAELRGDVDWRQVKELHESFKYEHSGLGPAAQLIIAIAMSFIIGPMAGGLGGTVTQAMTVSVATKATVSTINNRGNLGAVAKDITSSDSIKGYVVAGVTAGIGEKFNLGYNPSELGFNAESVKAVALKTLTDSAIKTAVYGGSFKDNLGDAAVGAAVSIGGAVGANEIGNLPLADGSLSKIALHAALGGLMAEAMGGDFRTGALAAGANEALVRFLGDKLLPKGVDESSPEYQQGKQNLLAASQIVGVLASVVAEGDAGIGAAVAANATANNFLNHQDVQEMVRDLEGCEKRGDCQQIRDNYRAVSDANRERLAQCQQNGNCADIQKEIAAGKIALDQLKGFEGAVAEADFNTRQWQDGNRVESILQQQGGEKAQAFTERSQREHAEAMVELGKSPEKLQQAIDMEAKAALQADLEKKLLASAELEQLAQKSAADLDDLMPGWRESRQQTVNVINGVKQGGVIVSEVISPDVWDALGPAAKVAKLAGIFAVMQKVPGKVSAELIETATKLDNLLTGKAPSPSDLAPFKKAAETKLAEEVKLANQTLASKPGASSSSVGGEKGSPEHTDLSQPGGLMATEGGQVVKPNGKLTNPTHPLERHGPDVTDTYLKDRVVTELVDKGRTGLRTAFNDRAQMESAISKTFAIKKQEIDAWITSNPKAGVPKAFEADPGMGNLGRGFEVLT